MGTIQAWKHQVWIVRRHGAINPLLRPPWERPYSGLDLLLFCFQLLCFSSKWASTNFLFRQPAVEMWVQATKWLKWKLHVTHVCVLSQVISLLMPNPCGGGKNLCLISPTLKPRGEPPVSKEMFEKCNFFDEKLNDIDCSVERDTRDYVGKNHSLAVKKNWQCLS